VAVEFDAVVVGSAAVDVLVVMTGCGVEVFIVITFRVVNDVFEAGLFPLGKGDVGIFELLVVMDAFVFI